MKEESGEEYGALHTIVHRYRRERRCNYRLLASLSRISRSELVDILIAFLDSANSLRAKAIMRLFDSEWIVGKRFSSFLADAAPGDSPKTF